MDLKIKIKDLSIRFKNQIVLIKHRYQLIMQDFIVSWEETDAEKVHY